MNWEFLRGDFEGRFGGLFMGKKGLNWGFLRADLGLFMVGFANRIGGMLGENYVTLGKV